MHYDPRMNDGNKPARIAKRVADLTDEEMALILAAKVPPEEDYTLADIDEDGVVAGAESGPR